jgi:hypothetical protein
MAIMDDDDDDDDEDDEEDKRVPTMILRKRRCQRIQLTRMIYNKNRTLLLSIFSNMYYI